MEQHKKDNLSFLGDGRPVIRPVEFVQGKQIRSVSPSAFKNKRRAGSFEALAAKATAIRWDHYIKAALIDLCRAIADRLAPLHCPRGGGSNSFRAAHAVYGLLLRKNITNGQLNSFWLLGYGR
jgi:hypothetical protein